MSLTDDGLDGSDEAYLVARGFENGFDHISSCCFSLGSGNTDDFQLLRRVIVPGCGNQGHRVAGIFDLDHGNGLRYLHRLLHQKSDSAFLCHFSGICVSIRHSSPDAEKKRPGNYLSGIIGDT